MVGLKRIRFSIFSIWPLYIHTIYNIYTLYSRILCNARDIDDTKRKPHNRALSSIFRKCSWIFSTIERFYTEATKLFETPVWLQKKIVQKHAEQSIYVIKRCIFIEQPWKSRYFYVTQSGYLNRWYPGSQFKHYNLITIFFIFVISEARAQFWCVCSIWLI